MFISLSLSIYSHERYVNIDRQKFRIKEYGKGDITVIFESGMSDSIEAWQSIPDSVAMFANVFLYDRAGIGKSGISGQERTIPNMVYELHAILEHDSVNPPYVLVGHSLGGFITRYFINQYPGEVKGLLLLDPAAKAWWDNMSEKELKEYKEGGDEWYSTWPESYRKEWDQLLPNREYMRNVSIPEDLAVILVSATDWNWYKYHKKIIKGLSDARHIELEGGHYIHLDHPEDDNPSDMTYYEIIPIKRMKRVCNAIIIFKTYRI